MSLYPSASSSKAKATPSGHTEFELLKQSHKFLREDDDDEGAQLTWEEKLASKYYANLYREFAVCDLKHYKSGNFALRWRTEAEVLSGAGETTCGNTRCKRHEAAEGSEDVDKSRTSGLTTLELPFAYLEHGESKSALVKVVLCEKCVGKLMWKRRKDKERAMEVKQETEEPDLNVKSQVDGAPPERRKHTREGRNMESEAHQAQRPPEKIRRERWDRDRDILGEEPPRERHRSLSPRHSKSTQSRKRRPS
ncbi:hypothetical protein VNI00_013616 [Paramarasmius palmivorus]|uniref:Protein FRA10AC1 n=1 Tax=Paramarasmius palmivorus TaxID=297713 RepID=A0AAW0BWR4_9AGAR